ncbi:MAG: hypothetical protein JST85_30285 [Acidobacteria bacterium]|nr:hypothetical protein [Acidobacteriota bacterium]
MKRYKPFTLRLPGRRLCLLAFGLAFFGILGWTFTENRIQTVSAQAQAVTLVNAASYATDALAPESLAAAYGSFVTTGNQTFVASSLPLPASLGGVRATIGGIDAGMIVASPGQLNLVVPQNALDGLNTVIVTNADGSIRMGTVIIQRAAPGIFTSRGSGIGAAVAFTTNDGVNLTPTYNTSDGSEREISAGTKDKPNYLILFVTGVRNAVAANPNDTNGVAESVTATIQGVPAQVTYAGRSGNFAGLDQINLIIPPELSGIGLARVRLNISGRVSNAPTILIGGQAPPIRATALTAGTNIFGVLSADDQIQTAGDGSGRTYYFDAYRVTTTAPNTPVIADLRSQQFDATVMVAQQRTDGSLNFIAADDQTGGLGNGKDDTNNALLLTVLPTPGDYLLFVTSADSEQNATGSYRLFFGTGGLQQINYSATPINAAIASSDLQTSAGDYLDAYWFAGTAGDVVQIRMNSTAFDSFLILNAANGDLIDFDDNSGGGSQGRDALLTYSLRRSGNYVILATPFAPGITGAYTLTVNRLNSLTAASEEARALGRTLTPIRGSEDDQPRRTQFDRLASRRILRDEQ